MNMKIKMLFDASVAVNVLLLCALAYQWHYTSRVPEYTPPLIWYVLTNSPAAIEANEMQLHNLQGLAGSDTRSINPIP